MQARNLDAYYEITQNYLFHLSEKKISPQAGWFSRTYQTLRNGISNKWYSMRNSLTGEYYSGEQATFVLLSMFGIKNAKYANFIALVDHIAKFDLHADKILNEILTVRDEEALITKFLEYYMDLQVNVTHKDEAYYLAMSTLKHDIHHLAIELKINKRIIKVKDLNVDGSDSDKHYKYEISSVIDPYREKEKQQARTWKSRFAKSAKFIAFCNILPEIFTVLAGYSLLVTPLTPVLLPLGILGAIYFGYKVAREDLYELCKQIYHRRLFKIKNQTTGIYDDLPSHQRLILYPLNFLCIIAGGCNAALIHYAVGLKLGAAVLGVIPSAPFVFMLSTFAFCLWGAVFYLPLKDFAKDISKQQLSDFLNRFKLNPIKELLSYGITLPIMLTVCFAGYFVFKDKCLAMFKEFPKVANGLSMFFSGTYTCAKFVLGIKKVKHLLEVVTTAVKNAVKNAVISIATSVWNKIRGASVHLNAEPSANPIQQANKLAPTTKVVKGLLAIARSEATSAIYGRSVAVDNVHIPFVKDTSEATSVSVLLYIGGLYTAPDVTHRTPVIKPTSTEQSKSFKS